VIGDCAPVFASFVALAVLPLASASSASSPARAASLPLSEEAMRSASSTSAGCADALT
jgi:hypothetical protein